MLAYKSSEFFMKDDKKDIFNNEMEFRKKSTVENLSKNPLFR